LKRPDCFYCHRPIDEDDAGVCDECFEPFQKYIEAGGTPREYFRALAQEVCRVAVQECVRQAVEKMRPELERVAGDR
jgi:hypothetical protein